jgi:peptidoglycan/xylan/chitin deacetylase (PgdA/CDA1 family)
VTNARPLRSLPGFRHAARAGRALAGALRRRSPRGVVLLYHRIAGPRRDPQWLDVTPEHFDRQLGVLTREATPLPLDEFEARRRAGRLPRRAVAVTFDDGYADNLHAAAPALVRHGIAATVFVTTGMVDSNREFWWDDIERIAFAPTLAAGEVAGAAMRWSSADAAQAPSDPAADRWTMLSTVDPTSRHRLYRALGASLHPLSTPLREARLAAWRAWAAVPTDARPSHRPLTLEELRALAALPGISIGAHTLTHPSLAALGAEEQGREITGSRVWLEQALGSPVRAFAYPFGTPSDVSDDSVRATSAEYMYAMSTTPVSAWRWSPRWKLPRAIVRDWDAETFAARLDALFDE